MWVSGWDFEENFREKLKMLAQAVSEMDGRNWSERTRETAS